MKKCPFCKAEIEENARFCLYCMKPLVEKQVIKPPNKRSKLWISLVILLVLCLSVVLVLSMTRNKPERNPTTIHHTTKPVRQEIDSEHPEDAPVEDEPAPCEHSYALTDSQVTTCTTDGFNIYTCSKCGNSYRQPDSATGHTFVEATCQLPETCSKCGKTQGDALGHDYQHELCTRCKELSPQQAQVVYLYKPALELDYFTGGYVDSETRIIITGIETPSASGVYRIPDTIDGKKPVFIEEYAFSGSGARQVYLPATIMNASPLAFDGCSLTDLYFTQNLTMEGDGFDGKGILTIHCPAECFGRSILQYSTYLAAEYNAVWEEWNGE